MATSVIEAFNEFMRDKVNLDSGESARAKLSRDWLMERIHQFPGKDAAFPVLNEGKDIFFGSFERKTKKRALDDIDIMVCMHAQGAVYSDSMFSKTVTIQVTDSTSQLYKFRHDEGNNLHSKRVINKFVSSLQAIDQYKKAEISRRGEAAVLNLQSYDWKFDIVPCFYTSLDSNNRQYYLIPDGNGDWQKTDPIIDKRKVERLVTARGSNMLNVVRLVKYWNKRPTMPSVPSYTLENMILNYYETHVCGDYPDLQFRNFVQYMAAAIFSPIPDPKVLQGDLNTLTADERLAVSTRCFLDHARAVEAVAFENAKEINKSIKKWAEIFGPDFPAYG